VLPGRQRGCQPASRLLTRHLEAKLTIGAHGAVSRRRIDLRRKPLGNLQRDAPAARAHVPALPMADPGSRRRATEPSSVRSRAAVSRPSIVSDPSPVFASTVPEIPCSLTDPSLVSTVTLPSRSYPCTEPSPLRSSNRPLRRSTLIEPSRLSARRLQSLGTVATRRARRSRRPTPIIHCDVSGPRASTRMRLPSCSATTLMLSTISFDEPAFSISTTTSERLPPRTSIGPSKLTSSSSTTPSTSKRFSSRVVYASRGR